MSLRKNAVGYLALFIALGGTSYAAVALPANSVGTRQLRAGAVTNSKVKSRSLSASVFSAAAIRRLQAASRVTPQVVTVQMPANTCGSSGCEPIAGLSNGAQADCPSGSHVVGGGYQVAPGYAEYVDASTDAPTPRGNGWQVVFTYTSAPASGTPYPYGTVYAVCVT